MKSGKVPKKRGGGGICVYMYIHAYMCTSILLNIHFSTFDWITCSKFVLITSETIIIFIIKTLERPHFVTCSHQKFIQSPEKSWNSYFSDYSTACWYPRYWPWCCGCCWYPPLYWETGTCPPPGKLYWGGYLGEEWETGPGPWGPLGWGGPGWEREETGLPTDTVVGEVGESPAWSEIENI